MALREEHRAITSIAVSRAKMVVRNIAGADDGLDAFDVADVLGKVSRGITNARPTNILERKWGRRRAIDEQALGANSSKVEYQPATLYADAVADSHRCITALMGALSECVTERAFVHEFGAVGKRSKAKAEDAKNPVEARRMAGKASRCAEGSSAAHELIKLGKVILADTIEVEKRTSQVAGKLVNSSW